MGNSVGSVGRRTGGCGGRGLRLERFGDLYDGDIMRWNIDWAGGLKNRNDKKINGAETKCWRLDFTGASVDS